MKKCSKKALALFLTIVMLVTSIPFAAFTVMAADGDAKDKYLFAYFTGNSKEGQRVRFAVSEDGYNYKALNNGTRIVAQTLGTQCARDPYIFQDKDGTFYLICTDMDSVNGSTWWGNSNSFVIWKSTDLINWTNETIINVSEITGTWVGRAWAPQIIWSEADNKYMIYFGLAADGYQSGTTMHYMLTDDLLQQSHYSKPVAMINTGSDSIDGDIWYDGSSTYYMYYKNEANATICYATSSVLTGPYTDQGKLFTDSSVPGLEGCNAFRKTDGTLVMLADAYGDGYFVVADSNSGSYTSFTLRAKNDGYSLNHLSPRHGAVTNITTAQYNALIDKFGVASDEEITYNFSNGLSIAPTDIKDWYYKTHDDSTGWKYDVMSHGGSLSASEGKLRLVTTNIFINEEYARDIVKSNSWTISFSHTLDDSARAAATVLAIGGKDKDFVRLAGDGTFSVNGTAASAKANIVRGVQNAFVITYDGSTVSLYQNGTLVTSVATTLNVTNASDGSLYIGVGFSDTNTSFTSNDKEKHTTSTYGRLRISPKAINSDYNVGEMLELMTEFEKLISSGNVYKNVGNAYNAYVQCHKAYDAYYYGGDTSVDINAETAKFRLALRSIAKWTIEPTGATAAADGSYSKYSLANDQSMSNVLYSYGVSSNANYGGIGNSGLQFGSIVYLYDGKNPCLCPINAYREKYNTGRTMSCMRVTSEGLTTDTYWFGVRNSTGYCSASDYVFALNDNERVSQNTNHQTGRATYYFTGMLKYSGGQNGFTNYVRTFDSTNWHTQDIATKIGGYTYSNAADGTYSAASIYVINYLTLADNIKNKFPSSISAYKEGGLADVFAATDSALALDLNSYFNNVGSDKNTYKSNLTPAINNCRDAISASVNTINDAGKKTDSSAYAALRTAIATYGTLHNENACPTLTEQYNAAVAAARNAMKAVYSADATATYSTDNEAIQNIATTLNGIAVKYRDAVHAFKWARDNEKGDIATFECDFCKDNYTREIQSYNAVAMIYDTLDSSKYTDEAKKVINDAKTAFDKIKTDARQTEFDQLTEIDDVTKKLLAAINQPLDGTDEKEKTQFTVTHQVYIDNELVDSLTVTDSYYYGQVANVSYGDEGIVTSWTIRYNDGYSKAVVNNENSYMLLVQQDTTIITYVRSESVQTYVTILNQYGNVLYSIPANVGDDILWIENTVEVGGHSVTVPNMPYMTVTGFNINGTAQKTAKVVEGENIVSPITKVVKNDYVITADGATVTVNDKETTAAKYDNVVKVTFPADVYAIAILNSDGSYAVAAYGNEYTFYASRNMTFYPVTGSNSNYMINGVAVTDKLFIHRLDYKLPFAYAEVALTDDTSNKYTTFSAYSANVPANVTILEKGTVFTSPTNADQFNEDTLVLGASGSYQKVNAINVGPGNQYSLGINRSKGCKTRAYVKYTYTLDSGEIITAVSYGNICESK